MVWKSVAVSEPGEAGGRLKLHLVSGFGRAVLAARCLPALPYVLWNGSNGRTVDDEEEDAVEATIGAKWVLAKEKVGDESDPLAIETMPSVFAAAAVASSFFSLDSSSFRSTFSSLLGEEDGEAAARGNTTDGDGLAVAEIEAKCGAGADEVV